MYNCTYKPMCWWINFTFILSLRPRPPYQGSPPWKTLFPNWHKLYDLSSPPMLSHLLGQEENKKILALNLQRDLRHLAAGRYISGWRWTLPRWGGRGWSPATFISQGSGSELKAVEGSPAISWMGAQALSSVDLWDLYFRVIFVKHNIM